MHKTNHKRPLPISEYQKRFFLEWALAPHESAYNVSLVNKIKGHVNGGILKLACNVFTTTNEVTHIQYTADGEYCNYADFGPDDYYKEFILNEDEPIELQIRRVLDTPFDLTRDVLLRLYLLKHNDPDNDESFFIISAHHIMADAMSAFQISKQIQDAYNLLIDGQEASWQLEKTFSGAVESEQNIITTEYKARAQSFWLDFIGDIPLNINLPYRADVEASNLNNRLADKTGGFIYFELSSTDTEHLRAYARQKRTTTFIILSAVYGLVLSKYSNQEKLMLSYPVDMRPRGFKDVTGCFVNNIPLKFEFDKVNTLDELIESLGEQRKSVRDYQGYSLTDIVQDQRLHKNWEIDTFFNAGITQADLNAHSLQLKYVETSPVNISNSDKIVSQLGLLYDEYSSNAVKFKFEYRTAIFDKTFIEKFIGSFKNLLLEVIGGTEIATKTYSVLNAKDYNRLIFDWNATEKYYPQDKTIVDLFEAQAGKTPDNIALICDGLQLTYRELNEKSNQLARYIRLQYAERVSRDLTADTLVALCLDKSAEMIIGILAVLKAGGAYVPVDPSYPQERVDYMLKDTGAILVLSKKNLQGTGYASLPGDKVIWIDLTETLYSSRDKANLPCYSKPGDLAYVIYTSGTTGKPKGVMVEHKPFAQFIYNFNDYLSEKLNSAERGLLSLTNYVFDIFGLEYALPLVTGYAVMLSSIDKIKAEDFAGNRIVQQTPGSLFHLAADYADQLADIVCLVGGEALSPHVADKLTKSFGKVFNVYGPAETVIWSSINEVENADKPYIGKPLFNEQLYVLDDALQPVPAGVIGELYIGGAGLCRGYLNLPELTAEKFIANPFTTEEDKERGYTRLYKTGDQVRWLPDGNLQYIGRNDDQVKIRGHRIELAEIESALTQLAGIKQTHVLARQKGVANDKYLIAYYVTEEPTAEPDEAFLRAGLSQTLPEYMIPDAFVTMKSFPLTVNGKLDKRALPDPDFGSDDDFAGPGTGLESRLCSIYADLLNLPVEKISTRQSFFRMGGNSILSIRLKGKLSHLPEFKNISVADLFKHNTISKLVQSIKKDNQAFYNLQKRDRQSGSHEVAIIGWSGAFSGANNIDELWQLVSNQQEGTRFYSREECEQLGVKPVLLNSPDFVPVSGKVEGIELFDPLFWEMSPNEARQLDPQTRKFLEHCWYTLETAGYAQHRTKSNIGVFAGSGNSNYLYDHILHGEMAVEVNQWEAMHSNNKDALATKIAYLLGLTGPANSINTACSTGLVSVIEACKSLQLGSCDMAIAGGVSLSMPYEIGYNYQPGMIASKDGHCRSFDNNASGTIPGSGVGVVLLKRLDDAIADNDHVLAVIKGYATNNDGDRKTGYTAPSVIGQGECIVNAQKMAGITSGQVDYIECHGTGTNLGDPIEIQALKEAFLYNQPKEKLGRHKTVLGAIKANIGHTDSAAGTAGLIKVIAMLQHQLIAGQVNYDAPNAELHLDETGFEIIKENKVWATDESRQRLAGVSSFGIGGTNAHVIIGEYLGNQHEKENCKPQRDQLPYIIPLSARSRQSLQSYKQALVKYLVEVKDSGNVTLTDIAYTLQERRTYFDHRGAYCAKGLDELIGKLKDSNINPETIAKNENKVVLMFPGQGAQYSGMAKSLYENEPAFAALVDECIAIANESAVVDIGEVLFSNGANALQNINETRWAQVSLFIIEYALAKYLEKLGVNADGFIGHSIGEYVAATLSGVFNLRDAIKLVIARGELMQSMHPGSMLAVNAQVASVQEIVTAHQCEISVINSDEDLVISGEDRAIDTLKEALDKLDIATIKLNTSHAYHSVMMEQAAEKFESVFNGIELKKPARLFISNVSGEVAGNEVITAKYWCNQLRNVVKLAKGIDTASRHFNHEVSFLEAGPGKGLTSFVNKYRSANHQPSIQTIQLLPSAKETAAGSFMQIAHEKELKAVLWVNGLLEKANENVVFEHARLIANLPAYQFDSQRCWLERGERIESKKYNSLDEMCYERSWERADLEISPGDIGELKQQNILLIIEDGDAGQNESNVLLKLLNEHIGNISFVTHKQGNNIKPGFAFDLGDSSHIKTILDEKHRAGTGFSIIYVSPSVIDENAALQILAVKNIFDWSEKTGNQVPKFISISFDNYEVIGTEELHGKPSLVYGVTKSVPFEFFTSHTKVLHIDLPAGGNYAGALFSLLTKNHDRDLAVVRGKYQWFATYRPLNQPAGKPASRTAAPVFLITGGLGGVGNAYADYVLRDNRNSTLILVGRTPENEFSVIYNSRFADLKSKCDKVIYMPLDIGKKGASAGMIKFFAENGIDNIDVVLHAAGVAAKSALTEKNNADIAMVVGPKITGIENLVELAQFVAIKNLVNCSSISSILPSPGNMEYTAANLYLDELSYRRHPGIEHMLTINLNQISDTGMAVDFMEGSSSKQIKSLNSLRSDEFPVILERLLQDKAVHHAVLSRYDFNREYAANLKLLKDRLQQTDRQNTIKITEESYTENEYKIAQLICSVLGLDSISIHDDFFRIGGNSILAIRLVSLLNISLGVQLSVKDIFKHKTVGNLSSVIVSSAGGFKYGEYRVTKGFADENAAFELSNVQQAYLYGRMDSFELGNVSTHGYSELQFSRFDADKFEAALNKLIARHGALRTIFKHEQQYILKDTGHYTVRSHGQVTAAGLEEIRGRLSHKVYQADLWPLFDFEVSAHEERAILHGSFDALIMDAASTGLFFKELGQLYGAADMEKVQLPALQLNFKDYMQQYGKVRAGRLFAEAEQYWSGKIQEYDFEARLPMVTNPGSISQPRFARLSGTVPQAQWQKIEDKAKQYDMSPTSVVLYAYGHILTKWSGHSRFTINLTLFNRLPLHEQVNDILGDFTVLELFNFKRKAQDTIHSALQEVHGELWNDIEHNLFDGIDFQRLIRRQAGISQHQSLSPVVLTSVLGNNHTDIRLEGYEGAGYSITQTSQVYLDNRVYNTAEGFVAEWDYVEQLFDPEAIGQMHADYCRLITQLAEADWASGMPELSLSARDEKIIREANSHVQPAVKETLTDLCLAGISRYPDNIAITDKAGSCTYKETGAYSYHIAGCLQENGHAQPGRLIGILSEKGHQQVIAALGIMQSGAAYLPLHVEWPIGRVDEVLQEGQVKTVLVSRLQYEGCIKGSQIASRYVWLVIEETKKYQPKTTPAELHKPGPEDIAYVIFTSGSTGKPKGVTIPHHGAANTIVAVNSRLNINSDDKVLALSELSFDLSVYDMFGLLAAGGTVVFPDQEKTKEPAHWYELIKANNITVWDTVPQLMQLLADYVSHKKEDLCSLKAVMMSGDWIPVKLPGQVKALSPEATVMSLGGATEGSIWSIWYEIMATDPKWSAIPYGQSMPNQKMYVLDGLGEHSPAGVRGEIYIGGEGVALGYWNDEQKTGASFISHAQLGRLYKTGDLGKWNKVGYIEFEGRKDNQVKLNGYRVELDEIAAKLTNIKGIDRSIVAIQDNQLVAYLVAEQAKDQPESQSTDKVSFKFEQKGIRKDLQPEYEIKGLQLNEKHYRLRKSYRRFEEGGIGLSKADLLAIQHKPYSQPSLNGKVQSWPDRLKHLLEPLSAMQLPDKVLPKYLYPSGGSTYAIQCYVVIQQDIENIRQGCYYYEPAGHYLAKVNNIAHNDGAAPIKLQFKLYKPAIAPLYGEMAIKLAWLELGHILCLLQQQLQNTDLAGQLTLTDTAEDDYHAMAEVSISLNANGQQARLLAGANEIDYLTKENDTFGDEEGHSYSLEGLDLFTRISELGQVVAGAQGLILFRGTAEPESLLRSGYQAQQLAQQLYGQDTGSCTLGFIPYEGLNYSMAVGAIAPEQKAEPESQAKKVSAEEYIKQQLERYLPAYMLPDYFISLKELPLTANGKVDHRQLPKVQMVQDEYVAPATEAERRICVIWQEVLGLDRVGITDDFFRIGGNSILAIRLVSLLNISLGVQLSVKDIFKHKTVGNLSSVIVSSAGGFKYGEYRVTKGFADENAAFELSNVQQAYLYGRMDSFELGNVSTHGYSELQFSRFDADKFEAALNKLIARHGALRTIFKHEQQYILKDTGHYTVRSHGQVTAAGLEEIRGRLSHKVYQADLWPLFDFEVSAHEERAILHGSFDALIMDAASTGLFFKELGQLYGAADMEKVQLPALQLNFKDYMQQYGKVRAGRLFAEAEQYWSGKIQEYDFEARLPMVTNPGSISQPRFARLSGTVPQAQWQKIEDKAKQYDMSPTSVVLYAYGHILTKWSGHSRFTINLTLFNRLPLHEQVNDILGDFTVLELFNFKRKAQDTIHSALQEVHGELWNDIEHNLFDGIDFQRLIRRQAGISQHQSLSPVVLTSVLGNNHTDIRLEGYEGAGYSITQTSQVYLDNRVYNTAEGFVAEWDYVEQLFDPEAIGQMHADYCRLITQLAEADWASGMPELSLSARDEKIIREANSHVQPAVKETLTDLCLAGISRYPDNIAITDKAGSCTYKETGAYSYHIAGCLQENGHAQPGRLIGILSEKGHQQVIAALGIMQSGAAYLPLHVEWPIGRVDEVLQEGQVKTVLVSRLQYEGCIKGSQIASRYVWLVIEETKKYQPKTTPAELHKPGPEDIAYVIFTSGSTGKPKGVTIPHHGAANTIVAVNSRLNINSDDKVLALSELSFDLSVYDMFGLLAAGGTVVFPDQEKTKEPAHWYELIKANNITVWDTVPQLMQLLADYVSHKKEDLCSLKAVMMSGDWIPVKLPGQVKALSPEATVMSLGGATEGSIWSIWYEIMATDPKWSAIPYGQSMPNQKMYVLDGLGEHSPAGVRGEIYIGGEGVALGYWNDEQKTGASFISHAQLGRLYKTGDLGKWNKVGYIEFEGRKDNQVKLNGYRVELDEIAAKLTNIKGIDRSIVAIQDNQLVAYLVAEQAKDQPESQSTDKVSFKFEQKGIRKDLQPEYEIKGLQLNEKHYRLRKSYRRFEEGGIGLSKADLLAIQHKPYSQPSLNGKVQSWPDRLKHLLEPLSAMQLPDKVLPKYLYPSGGSTYAIQCYVVIQQDIENIRQGCYYYEPAGHYLAKVNNIAHNDGAAPIKLQFKLYKPAIAPLYGEMAIKLAWLELGHILCLLQQQLQNTDLAGQLTLTDTAEDDYHAMAEVSISLNANGQQARLLAGANEIDYLTKENDTFGDEEGHSYSLEGLDLFTRISELGQVVAGAQGLILFRGTAEPESLLRSGYQAQQLAQQLYGQDTGSCTLGFIPYEGLNYSMAVGAIAPEQKAEPESQAKKVSAEEYIKQQLERYLPAYMLPDYFISLKELPLTANGKVDHRQLPKVQMVQDEYVAPATEAERRICVIWQEVLGLDRVGITDDFFRIGGNSILAIQVTHRMSSALACEMKVADVFKLRTINALLENTESMQVGEENITMVF